MDSDRQQAPGAHPLTRPSPSIDPHLSNSRTVRLALWGAVALGVLLAAWPAGLGADWLWGSAVGETDNHLWMFWWATRRLGGGGEGLVNMPEGLTLPLMDPVNLPIFAALLGLGPLVAWQGMLLWNVLLAAIGGGVLGRELAGEPGAAAGALCLATAAPLWGVIDFGITEAWPVGWLALHLALLIGLGRRGGWLRAIGAGLTLGLTALSGWYLAVFALLIELVVVSALLLRWRRPALLLQGGIALLMVLPRFLDFLGQRGLWAHRWMPPSPGPPGPRPDWDSLPVAGTDLLNLVWPHLAAVRPSKASYLGLVAVILAGIGLRKGGRMGWLFGAAALPLIVLALGYWPTVAGRAIGLPGPAFWLVQAWPALLGLSHWERAVGALLPLFAGLVALGARALPIRLLPAVLLLLAADATLLSPTPWPREGFVARLPPGLDALPGEGGVVLLPFDNGREPFSEEPARLYNRYQVLADRPVSENYEGIDALLVASPLVGALDAACGVPTTLPPYYQPPPAARNPTMPTGAALEAAVAELRGWGFTHIFLTRGRCRVAPRAIQVANATFGLGQTTAAGDWIWPIALPEGG
jgi:hypothetical protein